MGLFSLTVIFSNSQERLLWDVPLICTSVRPSIKQQTTLSSAQTQTGRKRAPLDLWFMSDSRLNWLQQLSDCWPSICCGQSKLQLLRGSRKPSLFQSSADKSNLTRDSALTLLCHANTGNDSPSLGQFPQRLNWSDLWVPGIACRTHDCVAMNVCEVMKTENVLCGLENERQTDLNKKDVRCHFRVHNVYMFLCALLPVTFETFQPLESSDVMKLNRNLEE